MLTLSPGSACDVCAEEYGNHCMPHSIPCGHVMCASCCTTIVEKTSSRLSPVCPFCRESFTPDSVRLIRMDFATSGWSTPRRHPTFEGASDFTGELLAKRTEQLLRSDNRPKSETRRLEDKVARIAAKKCSVEEVSALHQELESVLRSGKDEQSTSLFLSAVLLRAILMNHQAHSEASKIAKTNEMSFREKIEHLELTTQKLDVESKRQRKLYEQKAQESQQLRTEVTQLRSLAASHGVPLSSSSYSSASASAAASTPEPTSPTSPRATSPPTYTSASASASSMSPSRYNSLHSRSTSMSASAATRPTTPATPSMLGRSQTPAPSMFSHTSPLRNGVSARSMTPAAGYGRSYTPAPVSSRSMTPGPTSHYSSASAYARSQTPAPTASHHSNAYAPPGPPIPPKPRRLSHASPPTSISRTTSEEKAEAQQLWHPSTTSSGHRGVLVEDDHDTYYKRAHASPARHAGVSART
ncbi:hypothetical protein AGABI1DRAFT_107927 [Agaricus bisporus var. burnettii JB137-S8]|uniref:RING-type domain-containing protein n=1 Tax=Agaricus bisporus var. burnettii (strain JB137-S8 / ATCC MYA-4627 / FGSC 10392) TaxID=597362 RepID=K5X3L4_AGABU|nr:uncharacterized protein AGABI1DRAFT_107927 [Agaricus bisporus var. burnettii JB137-S8]EKM77758.1 hypothetical protein AGABI1DRAFT_107927 [Agaricus bisporus var. burnettii JB137-S8]